MTEPADGARGAMSEPADGARGAMSEPADGARGAMMEPADGARGAMKDPAMTEPEAPLGSLQCRRGEHLHAAAQYGASLLTLGSHRCRRGACSQRRPVRRAFSAVLWKSRVL
jgi:hypothetical protein